MSDNYEKFMNHEFGRKANMTFQQYLDFICAILLGSTGVGKSTIANALMGINLKVIQDKYSELLLTAENQRFKIGTDMKSTTTIPNIQVDEMNKLIICDPPGFFDNRTAEQDAINSFVIDQLFNAPNKIRILLVISEQEMSNWAARAKGVADNLELLEKMIPDQKILKESIGLIISIMGNRKPKSILKKLKESHPNKSVKKWMSFFTNNMDRVFTFPKATEDQIGDNFTFDDRNRLIQFIHESSVKQIPHKVILTHKSLEYMMNIISMSPQMDVIIKDLMGKCKTKYDNPSSSLKELNHWKTILTTIKKNVKKITNPKDIAPIVNTSIQDPTITDTFVQQIGSFDSLYQFVSHVKNLDSPSIKAITDQIVGTIQNEISLINHKIELIMANQKRKSAEQDAIVHRNQWKLAVEEKDESIRKLQQSEDDLRKARSKNQQISNENQELQEKYQRLLIRDDGTKNVELQATIKALVEAMNDNNIKFTNTLEMLVQSNNRQISELANSVANLVHPSQSEFLYSLFGPLSPIAKLIGEGISFVTDLLA